MTYTYTRDVATVKKFSIFLRLLRKWHASIYKIIWCDLILYVVLYYALSVLYHFYLNDAGKKTFESVVLYCKKEAQMIPVTFILGFYVSIIVGRWWQKYRAIPWPDETAVYISSLLRGQDVHGRMMRRTIVRYINLSLTMVLRRMCTPVKKKFPTLNMLIDFGLLNQNEYDVISHFDDKWPHYPKHFMPICWSASIVTRARKEGRITDDCAYNSVIVALDKYREKSFELLRWDWISVPLIYTQVVTLAVYSHFIALCISTQKIDSHPEQWIDRYVPIFTILQYLFFMGWLRVAEVLINPFGEDDDDFDLMRIINRDVNVGHALVDDMHKFHPELIEDRYWNEKVPHDIKYADESLRDAPPTSSAYFGKKNKTRQKYRIIEEDTQRDSEILNMEIFAQPSKESLFHYAQTTVNDVISEVFDDVMIKIENENVKRNENTKEVAQANAKENENKNELNIRDSVDSSDSRSSTEDTKDSVESIKKDSVDFLKNDEGPPTPTKLSRVPATKVTINENIDEFEILKAMRAKQRKERNERRARRMTDELLKQIPKNLGSFSSNNEIKDKDAEN